MLLKPPCSKTCPDRNSECHPTCKRYLDYCKALEESKENIKKNKEPYKSHYDYVIGQKQKWDKAKKNH